MIQMFYNAYSISIDCPKMINLALGLKLDAQTPSIWAALQSDCCTSVTGITCSSQRVTRINWSSLSLNGYINFTAIPSGLISLNLYGNGLTGNISATLPNGLQNFNVGNNRLTGVIPSTLPNGLINLHLHLNQINGTIPLLPTNLIDVNIGSNQLTGPIPTTLPVGLTYLHLDKNQLTGSIPQPLPVGLNDFSVGGNLLFGVVPSFPSTLEYLNLGLFGFPGNLISGSIFLDKPVLLYINDNLITDVVIKNMTQLTQCDLSNNPLLGNRNIINFTMCIQNGLYSNSSTVSGTWTQYFGNGNMINAESTQTVRSASLNSSSVSGTSSHGKLLLMQNQHKQSKSPTQTVLSYPDYQRNILVLLTQNQQRK